MRRIVVTGLERSRHSPRVSKRPGRVCWPVARASGGFRTMWWEICRRRSAGWFPRWKKIRSWLRSECRPGAEGSAQGRPVHSLRAGSGRRGACAGEMEACLGNGSPAHSHDHRVRDRRFPSHHRGGAHGGPARRAPPVAVYDTILPGEPRGGPHLDPPRLQRSTRRAGDGVRGRHPGDRRCGSSYPRKRSRHRRVRWNGSMHEHRQSRWFCCRTLSFHRLQ